MEKTKKEIAKDVMLAINSIDALKEKINDLTKYATGLMNSQTNQVELSLEDQNPDHPYTIKPLFEILSLSDPNDPNSAIPNKERPLGYMKIFPGGMPDAAEFHALIPTGIVLRFIDHLLSEMKKELAKYESEIEESIAIPIVQKQNSYTHTLAESTKT
jgi:hypothetical protein